MVMEWPMNNLILFQKKIQPTDQSMCLSQDLDQPLLQKAKMSSKCGETCDNVPNYDKKMIIHNIDRSIE